ncbi:MAG: glycerophosphodiester phosphodiesterase family protein, partial [Candidatus Kariarchaeum pelagius]
LVISTSIKAKALIGIKVIKNKNINCSIASPSWNLITQRHINQIHKRKLNSVVYSVNNERMFSRLINYNVDAIYTDNLKKMIKKFR